MNRVRIWLTVLRANRYTWALTFLVMAMLTIVVTSMLAATSDRSWAAHSVQVMDRVQMLARALERTATTVRDCLIVGPADYIDDYRNSRARVFTHLDDLRRMTTDNPAQQVRCDDIHRELVAKFRETDEMVERARVGKTPEATARFRTGYSRGLHARVEDAIDAFAAAEVKLRTSRGDDAKWWQRLSILLILPLTAATTLVGVKWWDTYQHADDPPQAAPVDLSPAVKDPGMFNQPRP